jgi:hypothetical protein
MFSVFNLSLIHGTVSEKNDSLTAWIRESTFCGVPRSILDIMYAANALKKNDTNMVSLMADIPKGRLMFSSEATKTLATKEPANKERLDRLLNTEKASVLSDEGAVYMRV